MAGQLETLVERTEDFTDSPYTSHEQRQAILSVCQLARQDTKQLVHAWIEAVRWCRLSFVPAEVFEKQHETE